VGKFKIAELLSSFCSSLEDWVRREVERCGGGREHVENSSDFLLLDGQGSVCGDIQEPVGQETVEPEIGFG
jgi:hypothetical protein